MNKFLKVLGVIAVILVIVLLLGNIFNSFGIADKLYVGGGVVVTPTEDLNDIDIEKTVIVVDGSAPNPNIDYEYSVMLPLGYNQRPFKDKDNGYYFTIVNYDKYLGVSFKFETENEDFIGGFMGKIDSNLDFTYTNSNLLTNNKEFKNIDYLLVRNSEGLFKINFKKSFQDSFLLSVKGIYEVYKTEIKRNYAFDLELTNFVNVEKFNEETKVFESVNGRFLIPAVYMMDNTETYKIWFKNYSYAEDIKYFVDRGLKNNPGDFLTI